MRADPAADEASTASELWRRFEPVTTKECQDVTRFSSGLSSEAWSERSESGTDSGPSLVETTSAGSTTSSIDSLMTDSSSKTASPAEVEADRPTSSNSPRKATEYRMLDQPSSYSPTRLPSLDGDATRELDDLAADLPDEAHSWDLDAACAAGRDEDKETDDWISLDELCPTVKVQVEMMLGEIPKDFRATLCRLHRKKLVSQLLVAIASRVWEDKCKLDPDRASTHIIAAGSTQIYKTTVPAAALLAGEPFRS